jgi:Pregnancy-associated plasma protein-A
VKRFLILLAAVLAFAAATTAPAGAGSVAVAGSEFCGDDVFSSVSALSTTSTARSGRSEPVFRNAPVNSNIPGLAPKVPANFSASVPVYFHIVHNGTTGNVSDMTIAEQMTVLNQAFSGFFGGADSKLSFTLAGVTRTNNAVWFDAEPESPEELAMKAALKRGGSDALNIYSTSGAQDALLGWAYYPSITVQNKHSVLDGVVINWGSMPGGPFGSAFSLGQTATHEAGHWLGLPHTFEGGCNGKGDGIGDTPAMLVPTSGCPAGKDTCPRQPGLDPIHNYMDYSFDSCYEEFTSDQVGRMQQQWLHWRLKRA